MAHASWHEESPPPKEWGSQWYWHLQDDIDAFQYYGTLGLYDPTIPAEVGVWKKSGAGLGKAIGFTFLRAVVPFAIVMWIIDPADKREGGLAETQWYQDTVALHKQQWEDTGIPAFVDWVFSPKGVDIYT